jgi:hypothetical protein
MKIISHLNPRHMDDFLAIAILKTKYPDAEIDFVHPQSVPNSYLEDPEIILVDVGGNYNPQLKNYDHHQDLNLPSSIFLVLQNEFEGILNLTKILSSQTINFIDTTDRFGVKQASEIAGVPLNKEEDKMRKEILLIDLKKHALEVGKIYLETIEIVKYSEWLNTFYKKLDDAKLLEEPRKIIRKEEEAFYDKLSKSRAIKIKNLNVLISGESLAPFHNKAFELGTDLIIEKNSMNPQHTSIIKNTNSTKTKHLDLSKVFNLYPKVFIHQNGFIAVIEVEINKVDYLKIIELLTIE